MFKPVRLDASTTVVSLRDPAFDVESEAGKAAAEAYAKVMFQRPSAWREMLKVKDGEKPTVFVVGVIPAAEATRIADECGLAGGDPQINLLQWRSFLACVRDVEGWQDVPKVKVDGVEYVDPVFLRKSFARELRHVANEVGLVGWRWNQLTEEEAKN